MEKKLLDHIFGQAAFTRPSSLYLGLSTTAFADSDNTTTASAKEPSGNAYARVQIDNISEYNTSGDDIRNSSSIDFAEATGSWGSIGYWGIFDGTGSSANMLMHGSFSSATTVASGDQFRISTGDFEINFPAAIYVGNDASVTVNNTNQGSYAKWRKMIGYALGFDLGNSQTNDVFEFYNSTDVNFGQDCLYLAVSASAFPTSGLTSNEVSTSGTAYSRVEILSVNNNFFSAATTVSGVTSISNSSAISFPEATSSWGNISHFAIFRGMQVQSGPSNAAQAQRANEYRSGYPTSNYPLISGALTSTKTVNSGDRLRFGIGDLVITAS
jgi:hypothetical protein